MKKVKILITVVAISLLVASCINKKEKKDEVLTSETTIIKELEETHQYNEDNVLLDNGKRWNANPETTEGIHKMLTTVKGFSSENNPKAFNNLKTTLEAQFAEVFARCTMKGEAHNQLHNYLKPMLAMFEGLASEEVKIQNSSVKILYKHLSQYGIYFE